MSDTEPAIPPQPAARVRKDHPRLAYLTILTTVLFAGTMVGVIYFRWLTLDEPRSFLEVVGNSQLTGTIVTVKSIGASDPLTLTGTLEQQDNYLLRFFLRPGQYALTADLASEGVYSVRFVVDRTPPLRLDLTNAIANIPPAATQRVAGDRMATTAPAVPPQHP